MEDNYIKLGDIMVYKLSIELADQAWKIYEKLNWEDKKTMGNQFITATDSVGLNIAEGCGRYHYLDRIKFYYNSRGSLIESKHWIFTLNRRNKITQQEYDNFLNKANAVHLALNKYIKSCYIVKKDENS